MSVSPMLVAVWLILLCWGKASTVSGGLILQPPINQTVPVNSVAVFTCRVIGMLVWEVNRSQIQNEVAKESLCNMHGVCINGTLDTSDEESESVLLVNATEQNNNTTVKCLAFEDFVLIEESEVAVLKVFDRPASPNNFLSSPVSHLYLNLSWDEPFIFPGVQISYTVTIRNVNTSEEIQKEGLEVTYYIFSGTEGSSMCDVYHFSVAAVNSAGRSDQSEDIFSSLPTLPNITRSIATLNHDVVLTNGEVLINIMFEPAESCQKHPVTDYSVMLQNDGTDAVRVLGPFVPSVSGKIEIQLNNAYGIVEDAQYNFSIMAANRIGIITSNKTECFTTDVQSASVSLSDSNEAGVIVTCQFADGSQALGCHVQFLMQSSVKSINMNISKNEPLETASGVITLAYPLTCYDICAFDWESDGTRGEVCVPVRVGQTGNRGDCGSGPDPESDGGSSQSLGVVLGGAFGGVVAVLAVTVMAVMIWRVKVYRRKETVNLGMSTNPAYGVVPFNSATTGAGRSGEAPHTEISTNPAYGVIPTSSATSGADRSGEASAVLQNANEEQSNC